MSQEITVNWERLKEQAKAGGATANLALAIVYLNNKMGQYDPNLGVYHLIQAAKAKQIKAFRILNHIRSQVKENYYEDPIMQILLSAWTEESIPAESILRVIANKIELNLKDESIDVLQKRADTNDSSSQYLLAKKILVESEKNIDWRNLAKRWFQKASENGLVIAQLEYADRLYNGRAIPQDQLEAVKWYQAVLDNCSSRIEERRQAQFGLSKVYEKTEIFKNKIDSEIDKYSERAHKLLIESAQLGNIEAQLALIKKLLNLKGELPDFKEVVYWARTFYINCLSKQCIKLLSNRLLHNWTPNTELLNKEAPKNDINSALELISLTLEARYVTQDKDLAIKQLIEFGNNDANAQACLALIYLTGTIVEQDFIKAFNYARKSAELGNISSKYLLGLMYAEGLGVEKDFALAANQFRSFLHKPELEESFLRFMPAIKYENLPSDFQQIISWLIWTNENIFDNLVETVDAERYTAMCLVEGNNCPRDPQLALAKFSRLAQAYDSESFYQLGLLYARGEGAERNTEKALYCWQRAAELGSAEAQVQLAALYRKGNKESDDLKSTSSRLKITLTSLKITSSNLKMTANDSVGITLPYNIQAALMWLDKAAHKGNLKALQMLADIYYRGQEVKKDVSMAAKFLREASNQGDAQSQWQLANLYLKGEGVEQDSLLAYQWTENSAALGYEPAIKGLKDIRARAEKDNAICLPPESPNII